MQTDSMSFSSQLKFKIYFHYFVALIGSYPYFASLKNSIYLKILRKGLLAIALF